MKLLVMAMAAARSKPIRRMCNPSLAQSPCVLGISRNSVWDQRLRNGAQGRNRTADTRIFSPLLYQLSYLALGSQCNSAPHTLEPLTPVRLVRCHRTTVTEKE